jgi:hypothetical protein
LPPGSGRQRLPLSLLVPYQAEGEQPLTLALDGIDATIARVEIVGRSGPGQPVEIAPQNTLDITFGDPPLAALVGYDLGGEQISGGELELTLYWRVQHPTDRSYKIFVHLIGPDGLPAAQGDDFPLQGDRPTATWQPGETLVDSYTIVLSPDLAPGSYPLRLGFYDPAAGDRLTPVLNEAGEILADGQVELGIVAVK